MLLLGYSLLCSSAVHQQGKRVMIYSGSKKRMRLFLDHSLSDARWSGELYCGYSRSLKYQTFPNLPFFSSVPFYIKNPIPCIHCGSLYVSFMLNIVFLIFLLCHLRNSIECACAALFVEPGFQIESFKLLFDRQSNGGRSTSGFSFSNCK